MNRVEYMTKLASLLQDVPVEERQEAMKYYNDYFDEAGEENEEAVTEELDTPEQVAAAIKAELYGKTGNAGEYRETGYTDTRFEQKESLTEYGVHHKEKKSERNGIWKVILIILLVLCALPIVGPVGIGVLLVVAAVLFSGFIAILSLIFGTVCITICGVVCFVAGLTQIAGALPVAFVLIGTGLLIFVAGLIGTVLLIKLSVMAFPPMFRWLVNICRKPFHRKAVSE